jgi:hypothetical protein
MQETGYPSHLLMLSLTESLDLLAGTRPPDQITGRRLIPA